MANILIRNLSDKTVAKLKKRAKANKRSLQAELQLILEREVEPVEKVNVAERLEAAARIRRMFEGREQSDAVDLIREDRDR